MPSNSTAISNKATSTSGFDETDEYVFVFGDVPFYVSGIPTNLVNIPSGSVNVYAATIFQTPTVFTGVIERSFDYYSGIAAPTAMSVFAGHD